MHTQLCPTLCNPWTVAGPGSSVHVILQARLKDWVTIPFSKGSSWPRDWNPGFLPCRQIVYHPSYQGSPPQCINYPVSYISLWIVYFWMAIYFCLFCRICVLYLSLFFPKRTRQNTEFSHYFSLNWALNYYTFSRPPWPGISPSCLFLLNKAKGLSPLKRLLL